MFVEPLVSIITPAYNAERYIRECIQSVQNQGYKRWEMIIVNDSSKDDTAAIVEKEAEADPRIRLISLEQNQGVVHARNTALKSSRGRFIAFLDSDDVWLPHKLEKQVREMLTNNWAMSYTSYSLINEDSQPVSKTVTAPPVVTYKQLLRGSSIGCLTVVLDKEKTGEILMPKIHHEDYATWLSILSKGIEAHGIVDQLALYRVSNASLSGNKKKSAGWQWAVYRQYLGLGWFTSAFYFTHYAINGIKKHM